MSLLCYGEVLLFFSTLRPSNLITTLTYILMENFCPCIYTFVCLLNHYNLLNKIPLPVKQTYK